MTKISSFCKVWTFTQKWKCLSVLNSVLGVKKTKYDRSATNVAFLGGVQGQIGGVQVEKNGQKIDFLPSEPIFGSIWKIIFLTIFGHFGPHVPPNLTLHTPQI